MRQLFHQVQMSSEYAACAACGGGIEPLSVRLVHIAFTPWQYHPCCGHEVLAKQYVPGTVEPLGYALPDRSGHMAHIAPGSVVNDFTNA